jgi:hypothetical protein
MLILSRVTVGALVGACFPSLLGWCRHHDSHFLRALQNNVQESARTAWCGKRYCIDMINSLPGGTTSTVIRLGPMAESRLYIRSPASRRATPASRAPHHYTFTLIATDLGPTALQAGMTRDELMKALDGHAKGATGIIGTFSKP